MGEPAEKKIREIVGDNYVFGAVLFYFGIEFYQYSDRTLREVCRERGLAVQMVINRLESVSSVTCEEKIELQKYPLELVIEYLKHTHYLFVKEKLPYLARLIESLTIPTSPGTDVISDLKFVFPIFVEDFIHHIYEEEDTLFTYALRLNKYLQGKGNVSSIFYQMESHSLQHFAMEHGEHDDEMRGIRSIAKNYTLEPNAPLQVKVLFAELISLERDLKVHAKVENEILFPKALMMEQQVRQMISKKISLN